MLASLDASLTTAADAASAELAKMKEVFDRGGLFLYDLFICRTILKASSLEFVK